MNSTSTLDQTATYHTSEGIPDCSDTIFSKNCRRKINRTNNKKLINSLEEKILKILNSYKR